MECGVSTAFFTKAGVAIVAQTLISALATHHLF
jgi:hypothetical protein